MLFVNLSECGCSQSESDCDCLETGFLLQSDLCNHLVTKRSHLKLEDVAHSISGKPTGRHAYLKSVTKFENIHKSTIFFSSPRRFSYFD